MTRALRILVIASVAAGALAPAAHAYPTHVSVSLTRLPGNTCCAKFTRAQVSARGVLTTSVAQRGGTWHRVARRKLRRAELARLRSALRSFDPSTLHGNQAACGGPPIGDVGGYELRVGTHESNCPPAAADRLIGILKRWLPR